MGENDEGQPTDAQGQIVDRFSSKILPPYLRKTKSIEELIPWLYLKGVSTGDFTEALQALLGKDAPGLGTGIAWAWFSNFFEWALVNRVNRRMPMRIVRL